MASRTGLERAAEELPQCITDEVINNTMELIKNYDVIGFDEAQFYRQKCRVNKSYDFFKEGHSCRLKYDYSYSFGKMGDIIAMADEVEHLYPVCASCKKRRAIFSQRLSNGEPVK